MIMSELETIPTQETTTDLELSVMSNLESIFAQAENLKAFEKVKALTLSPKYAQFVTPGQKMRGVYAGNIDVKFKDDDATSKAGGVQQYKEAEAVMWVDADKNVWLCAGVSLINELKKFSITFGMNIEIALIEKKGKTNIFSVGIIPTK